MFKIDNDSSRSVPAEIDYFTVPITNVGVESSRVVEISTSNSVQTVPYEFRLSNSKNFIDLQRSYILVRCSIRDGAGARIAVPAANPFGPINLIGQTMFRQVQAFISGVQVFDSGVLYPYRAYIQSVCGNSPDYKRTQLGMAGYTDEIDPAAVGDPGYATRCAWAAGSATMEFIAPISADLFQQPRALLPFVDFRLVLHPASDAFRIQQRAGAGQQIYSLVIEDLVFLSRQLTCHDSTMLAIDTMLREQKTFGYQLNSVQTRSFFISAGRTHAPEQKLFTSGTPRRLICGFVAAANFNGTIATNPFDFRPFGVSEIFLDMGSDTLPLRSWQLDFPNGRCGRAYLALQETLGFTRSGESNGITLNQYRNGFTLFGFDISPNSQDNDSRDLLKVGETSLRVTFANPIPAGGIYCVVFAEFTSELRISHDRVPALDSIL